MALRGRGAGAGCQRPQPEGTPPPPRAPGRLVAALTSGVQILDRTLEISRAARSDRQTASWGRRRGTLRDACRLLQQFLKPGRQVQLGAPGTAPCLDAKAQPCRREQKSPHPGNTPHGKAPGCSRALVAVRTPSLPLASLPFPEVLSPARPFPTRNIRQKASPSSSLLLPGREELSRGSDD